jgi:hypothetical protein
MVERGGEGRGTGWRRRRGGQVRKRQCVREREVERERGSPGVRREEELSPRGFKPVEFRQWCLWV